MYFPPLSYVLEFPNTIVTPIQLMCFGISTHLQSHKYCFLYSIRHRKTFICKHCI